MSKKILGIDYGRKKIGLSIAEGKLASPLKVLRVKSQEEAILKIGREAEKEKIEKIVVGISEREMGEEIKEFTSKLKEKLDIPITTWDETLSTKDAIKLSIEAGIKQEKRRKMEDAYSATIMLQEYIESNEVD